MKPIRFIKMHGLGNDFVIIDNLQQTIDLQKIPITKLANRHTGIGFDQLLVLEPSKQADFFCRIFNADGSQAEQCGNGLRCVARFAQEQQLITSASLKIETLAGIFPLLIDNYDQIRVTMGTPNIQEKLIELEFKQDSLKIPVSILSLGNPHAILKVELLNKVDIHQLGPKISAHSYFPNDANVGFMQIINQQHIRLRTFERGIGETHACGSNACAAVAAGIVNGWLQHQVKVEVLHGDLFIEWQGNHTPLYLCGPATRVYAGEMLINL